jgi:hypothetical protein
MDEQACQDNATQDQAGPIGQTSTTPYPLGQTANSIETNQKPKPSGETTNPKESASDTQKETLDAIKKGERIALIIAGIVAFGTLGQWITSCNNNASTSRQTDQLIAAAKISAQAAKDNVAAANNFASSARNINDGIDSAVSRLNRQANATSKLGYYRRYPGGRNPTNAECADQQRSSASRHPKH